MFLLRTLREPGANLQIHLADAGEFNRDLLDRLSEAVISLKPLQQRKRDIPVIARHFLEYFNRKTHKDIRDFSDDALNSLVDYEWPLNIRELRQVVDRAVAICRGDRIRDQHIFLDISPFSATAKVNLLKTRLIANVACHRLFPAVLRYATIPFFLLLIFATLLGPRQDNLANLVVWVLWWPLLIFSVAISARSWCGYCPLPPISDALSAARKRHFTLPRFLKKHGVWVSTAGFLGIVWAEHSAQMFTQPRATGILLLAILGGAVLTTLLFGKRIWCQHLCPLGRMLGECASISLVSLRSNDKVCTSQCHTHDCINGPGCPMGLHPSAARTSQECILCLSCVKACTHKAVRLDARLPWQEVLNQRKWEFSRALFAVLLLASVLGVKAPHWLSGHHILLQDDPALNLAATPGPNLFTFTGVIGGFTAFAFLASGLPTGKNWKEVLARLGHAYLPLAFAGFFNIYFREFVDRGHHLLPLAVALLGLGDPIPASWVTPNLGTLKALFPLITLVGSMVSFYMLRKIHAKTPAPRISYASHQLILLGTTLILLVIL